MPTVQFAEVPNKSSIYNSCYVNAIMFILYYIVARGVLDLQSNFQKLRMAMYLFQANVLSETKSINAIFLTYF